MTAKDDGAGRSTENPRDAIRKRLESAVAARRDAMSGSQEAVAASAEESDLLDELLLEATSADDQDADEDGFGDLGDLDALIDDALTLPDHETTSSEEDLYLLLDDDVETSGHVAAPDDNADPTASEDPARGRQDTPTLDVATLDPKALAAFRARASRDTKAEPTPVADNAPEEVADDEEIDLSDDDVAALFDDDELPLRSGPPPAPQAQLQETMEVAAVLPLTAEHATLDAALWDLVDDSSDESAHAAQTDEADDSHRMATDQESDDAESASAPEEANGVHDATSADAPLAATAEDETQALTSEELPQESSHASERANDPTPLDTAAIGGPDGPTWDEDALDTRDDAFEAPEDRGNPASAQPSAAEISTPTSTGSDRILLAAMEPADSSHSAAGEESSLAALVLASGEHATAGSEEPSDDLNDDIALLEAFESTAAEPEGAQEPAAGRIQLPMPSFEEGPLPPLPHDLPSFREQAQRLARRSQWRVLAAWTTSTVNAAPWAVAATAVPLLQDLARLYRDRLRDADAAWQAWEAVLSLDPAHDEALEQLCARWETEGQFERLYNALMAGVTAGWDPELRLQRTEEAARVALERLQDPTLAAQAWEQLWQLGDAPEASARALANLYRRTEKWSQLAAFLQRHAERDSGGAGLLAEREAASLLLHVLDDSASAVALLERRVQEGPFDGPAVWDLLEGWMRIGAHTKVADFGLQTTLPTEEGQWRLERAFQLLWGAGRRERVAPLLEALRAAHPERDDLRECAEALARELGDTEALIAFLEARLAALDEHDEARVPILRELAIVHSTLNAEQEALAAWQALLILEPQDDQALANVERLGVELSAWEPVLQAATQRARQLPDAMERLLAEATAARAAMACTGDPESARELWWSLAQRLPLSAPLLEEAAAWWQLHGDLPRQRALSLLRARRAPERATRLAAAQTLYTLSTQEPADHALTVQAAWMLVDKAPQEAAHQDQLVTALEAAGEVHAATLLAPSDDLVALAQRWAAIEEPTVAELLLEVAWRREPTPQASAAWAEALVRGGREDVVLAVYEANTAALDWVRQPDTLPAWWHAIPEDKRDTCWRRWSTATAIVDGAQEHAAEGEATLAAFLHTLTLQGAERRDALLALAEESEGLEALGFNPMAVSLAAVFDQEALRASAGALHARAALSGHDLVHEAVLLACTEATTPEETQESIIELARFLGSQPERAAATTLVWMAALRGSPEDEAIGTALDALAASDASLAPLRRLALTLALHALHERGGAQASAQSLNPSLVPPPAVAAYLEEGHARLLAVAEEHDGAIRELLLTEALRRAPDAPALHAAWRAHAARDAASSALAMAILRWCAAQESRPELYQEALALSQTLGQEALALDLLLTAPDRPQASDALQAWLRSAGWHGEAQAMLEAQVIEEGDDALRLVAARQAWDTLQDTQRALDHLEALPPNQAPDATLLEALGEAAVSPEDRLRWVRLMQRHVEAERLLALQVEEATLLAERGDEREAATQWEAILNASSAPAALLDAAKANLSLDHFAAVLVHVADESSEDEVRARLHLVATTLPRQELAPATRARLRSLTLHNPAAPDPLREVASLRTAGPQSAGDAVRAWAQTPNTCTPARAMLAAGIALHEGGEMVDTVLSWLAAETAEDRTLRALELALAHPSTTPDAWLAAARRLVGLLSDDQASWALCALAERVLTLPEHQHHAITLYREARTRHPGNPCAREALRAWGRRQGALPSGPALLAGGDAPGSMDLDTQRAWLEGQVEASAGAERLAWCRRRSAVAPDDPAGWTTLADALRRNGQPGEALACDHIAIALRTAQSHVDAASAPEVTQRWLALGRQALQQGSLDLARACRDACLSLEPETPAVVLLRAEVREVDGDLEGLRALLLQEATPLLDDNVAGDERVRAQLAWLCATHGVGDRIDNLQRALTLDARHAKAAAALASESSLSDRPLPERISWVVRALSTEAEASARGQLYAQLAEALEDQWAQVDEAAAACDLALAYGVQERSLLRRILRHCRQRGETQRGLELVDQLLPQAAEPPELAALWLLKGQILLGDTGRETEATEAFDMALSYDTSLRDARLGLAQALERRGDWSALLDLLEGMVQEGDPHERASAWLLLARVRDQELGDADMALDAAAEAWRLAPNAEAARLLLQLTEATGRAPVPTSSLYAHLVEAGELGWSALAAVGEAAQAPHEAHAWCLLAPAMVIRGVDEGMRQWLKEKRKSLERPSLRWSAAWNEEILRTSPTLAAFSTLLSHEESALVESAPESWWRHEAPALGEVSPHAPIGRAWSHLREAAGLGTLPILRAEEGPTTALLHTEDGWQIRIRQDILPHLMRAELGYTLASIAWRAQPGLRLLSSLSPLGRRELVEQLVLAARDEREAPWAGGDTTALGEALRTRSATESLLETLDAELRRGAAAAGLLAGPDLLQVLKLLPVLADAQERPAAFASPEQFDTWVLADASLRTHAAIAIDAAFAEALASTPTLG